jgi:membrane-associated protease RseP (regulator of RpoE activity)
MVDHPVEGGRMNDMNEPQTPADVPPLRPEAYVVRGDRTLAAMVLLICTLGGVGIGFGTALYMLRVSALGGSDLRPHKVTVMTWLGAKLDTEAADVRGARLQRVYEESPAEKAGLLPGDVVLRVDDNLVTSPDDLVREIRDREPGDRVFLVVDRGGRMLNVRTYLGQY